MLFVQRNDMIQHFAAATADPALTTPFCHGLRMLVRTALRPLALRNPNTSLPNFASRSNPTYLVATRKRQSLPELLDDPIAGRVRRDIEMQNPPSIMVDYKEAIKHAERYGWYREEVESGDHFAVIVQEGQPTFRFALITTTL